jgi:hypothetical protein
MLLTIIKKVDAESFVHGKSKDTISVVTNYGSFVSVYCHVPGENFYQRIGIDGTCVGDATELKDSKEHIVVLEKVLTKKKDGTGYQTNLWLRFIGDGTEALKYLRKNVKFAGPANPEQWNAVWGEVAPKKERTETPQEDSTSPDLSNLMSSIHDRG